MSGDLFEDEGGSAGSRPLWAVFEVQVDDACPLTEIEPPIASIQAQQIGDTCECEVVTDEDDVDVVRLERARGPDCLADLFHRHDCVPHVTAVREQSLRITVHPPKRETIGTLLSDIRAAGYNVRTERIRDLRNDDETESSLALIDRTVLTDKQRRAVELALEVGYYDDDKHATLETLAEELEISRSALSRRLRAAEAKLVRAVFAGST